jgi:two-component system alkaline phosphatase synthesis response regulator PhoP
MTEGIERAVELERSETDELFFICIVADDINFMPQLKILREETDAPILIATSKANYTEREHHESLSAGADFYAEYCQNPEQNIEGVLSAISSISRRAARLPNRSKRISSGDIYIAADRHKAFIKDAEIVLNGTEMKIFHYLTLNRGSVVSHEDIFRRINDGEHGELTPDTIYSTMKRLRKKIRGAVDNDYIETIRNVGYRLR